MHTHTHTHTHTHHTARVSPSATPLKPHPPEEKQVHVQEDRKRQKHSEQVKEDSKPRQDKARPERRRASHDKIEKEEEKSDEVGEEAPVKEIKATKLLDELFRKTKATPCVYWLPLTDAQVR